MDMDKDNSVEQILAYYQYRGVPVPSAGVSVYGLWINDNLITHNLINYLKCLKK